MSGLPYMPFYIGDWLKDPCVQALDYELQGIWFRLLCYMHESEERGVLRMPDAQVASLLRLTPSKTLAKLSKLLQTGVASRQQNTGYLMNRRMVREAAHYQQISEKRAEAGRKGGLAKAKQNSKQNIAPSSSSSDSSSNQKEKHTDTSSEESEFSVFSSEPEKTEDRSRGFEQFWMAYPNKKAIELARTTWQNLAPDAVLQACIMAGLERAKKSKEWAKENGRWIPYPSKWLKEGRWNDIYRDPREARKVVY